MNTTVSTILTSFSVGAIVTVMVDRLMIFKLEKKKILFERKFACFSKLSSMILGLSLGKEINKNVFEDLSSTAEARLFISDEQLDKDIHNFFLDLDKFRTDKNTSREDFGNLQKKGLRIFENLKVDLRKTL